jgi:hypothetical protein
MDAQAVTRLFNNLVPLNKRLFAGRRISVRMSLTLNWRTS